MIYTIKQPLGRANTLGNANQCIQKSLKKFIKKRKVKCKGFYCAHVGSQLIISFLMKVGNDIPLLFFWLYHTAIVRRLMTYKTPPAIPPAIAAVLSGLVLSAITIERRKA